jgi:hypothetical protein
MPSQQGMSCVYGGGMNKMLAMVVAVTALQLVATSTSKAATTRPIRVRGDCGEEAIAPSSFATACPGAGSFPFGVHSVHYPHGYGGKVVDATATFYICLVGLEPVPPGPLNSWPSDVQTCAEWEAADRIHYLPGWVRFSRPIRCRAPRGSSLNNGTRLTHGETRLIYGVTEWQWRDGPRIAETINGRENGGPFICPDVRGVTRHNAWGEAFPA